MMNSKIEKMKGFRVFLLNQIESLTPEQLNCIPENHSNNIIWNLGHLISAQQNMCYARSGVPFAVEEKYVKPYLPGTKPEGFIDADTIKAIKELMITSIELLRSDLNEDKFKTYTPSIMIPKVYGFEVPTIDEALEYLLHHEGYHTGCILSLKRLL